VTNVLVVWLSVFYFEVRSDVLLLMMVVLMVRK